ncbi:hypothetical protein PLICRDRAFT_478582 [Plicaturopsis crispa FD-325 SS-3]|nr:hypothetical protein PLICRDRAFT_478582 [Plicaturopsis crispa FD-325 SS-3]
MHFSVFVSLALLLASASAHPGEPHEEISQSELLRRQSEATKRQLVARNCASSVSAYTEKRKAKRSLKRAAALGQRDRSTILPSTTGSAEPPHFSTIQNFTCVTAPEVTEGPYYINNELVRQDLTETQAGVKLVLDIGVIDVTTCQPLDSVFMEIWAANATGVYSSYAAQLNTSGLPPPTTSGSMTVIPTGAPQQSLPLERNETFLRGGWITNPNGVVELTTIYPGYYEGRTPHIHVTSHLNWSVADNGTLISHAGTVIHIGQFFFNETWNDKVFATDPYTQNTNNRTLNSEDSILAQENADGNNAFLDLYQLGDDITDGVLGYITVGVNSSASYNITNTNYLNSTGAGTSSGVSTSSGTFTSFRGSASAAASAVFGHVDDVF